MRRILKSPVFVICLLLLIALSAWLVLSPGTSSEDAWYDVDEDGNFIVSLDRSIFWVDSARKHREELVSGREVAFLPGGEAFLFENDNSIWRFNLRDKIKSRVTQPSPEQIDWYPSFSKSTSLVVFSRAEHTRQGSMGGTTGESFDIYTCGLDGSDLRRITNERFYSLSISPQSTSKNLLYFVGVMLDPMNSEGEVYRLDLVSGSLTHVAGTSGALGVSVSHDGLKLAIMREPEYYSIQLLDLAKGTTRMVRITGDEWVDSASFSADDQNVYFLEDKYRTGNIKIMQHDLSDGKEVELLEL